MDFASLNILVVPTMQILLCIVIASLFKMAMQVPGKKKDDKTVEIEPSREDNQVAKIIDDDVVAPSLAHGISELKENLVPPVEPGVSIEDVDNVDDRPISMNLEDEMNIIRTKKSKPKARAPSLDAQLGSMNKKMIEQARKTHEELTIPPKKKSNAVFCCFGA